MLAYFWAPSAVYDCLVSFGSNLGDGRQAFAAVVQELARQFQKVHTSRLFRTAAIGDSIDAPDFLNGAITFSTPLEPVAVHRLLSELECQMGRARVRRWGPRTVDLDLLLCDDLIQHGLGSADTQTAQNDLCIPHPRMSFRRFVLQPACQIAAEWRHPVCRATLGELLEFLDSRPNRVGVLGKALGRGLERAHASRPKSASDEPIAFRFTESTGERLANPPPDQFEITVFDDGSQRPFHLDQLKLLVFQGPIAGNVDAVPRILAMWRGPQLAISDNADGDEAWLELSAAVRSTRPDSILGFERQ